MDTLINSSARRTIAVSLAVTALIAAVTLLSVTMRPASGAGFSNPAPIAFGPAQEVKTSSIVVSGQFRVLTDVNATLTDLTHVRQGDMDVLLEGPTGVRVMLLSDIIQDGGACISAAANLNLTFDDAAPGPIPSPADLVSGTYKPTDIDAPTCELGDGLVPAPTATTMSAFNGTNPNGTWTLYMADDVSNASGGTLSGGWSLDLSAVASSTCPSAVTTIEGSDGNDTILGTAGNDVIAAGAGDDIVRGLGGDDIICGGTGNDRLKGKAGKDTIYGEAGRDKLNGGGGKDRCFGGADKDAIGCEKAKQN